MNHDSSPLVKTENISRRYGGLMAVSNLSFEVHAGEILGLIGPNGAGKSTTFNLISGFVKPSSGKLHINGRDVTGQSAAQISRMGLVRTFQHGSLMKSLSVHDNILIGAIGAIRAGHGNAREERVKESLQMLELEPYLNDIAGNLSHGIQRLVSIAIAYAAHPRLLCLDEPLTGLNQTEATNTLNLLRRIREQQGCAILLVEHNMKAVMQICERIVVLHHGQMLATGTPTEIRSNENVIAAYLGSKHAK
jgi:branched-chain amino acid transport system ATP-binding protein